MAISSATPCPPTTTSPWPSSSASATICKTSPAARGDRLGRTLGRWRHQIAAWHKAHLTTGPTEAVNNPSKRVKRSAFGLTPLRHYRIRALR
jgi:transposase